MQSRPCQLLIDPRAGGAWNMAVDEVLLSTAAQTSLPTLRFYQWQRPTLSLGYFQTTADRAKHRSSFDTDTVRRLSGGGAILHDQDLTYSLVLPASHASSRDTQSLYEAVHQAIVTALNSFLTIAQSTWQARLCEQPSALAAQDEPFLCFERRSIGDIVLRNKDVAPPLIDPKIVGSAQRRRQGAVLQHGSILLRQSSVTPELGGVAEIADVNISPADLLAVLPGCLAKNLSIELSESFLPTDVASQAEELQQQKYQQPNWTERG
jgi:lipoate-protein ligase A